MYIRPVFVILCVCGERPVHALVSPVSLYSVMQMSLPFRSVDQTHTCRDVYKGCMSIKQYLPHVILVYVGRETGVEGGILAGRYR